MTLKEKLNTAPQQFNRRTEEKASRITTCCSFSIPQVSGVNIFNTRLLAVMYCHEICTKFIDFLLTCGT